MRSISATLLKNKIQQVRMALRDHLIHYTPPGPPKQTAKQHLERFPFGVHAVRLDQRKLVETAAQGRSQVPRELLELFSGMLDQYNIDPRRQYQ